MVWTHDNTNMSKEHPVFPFNSPMHLITLFGWSSYPWSYHKTQEISVAPRKGLDLRSYAPWFSPWWSVCETRVLINTVHCLPQASGKGGLGEVLQSNSGDKLEANKPISHEALDIEQQNLTSWLQFQIDCNFARLVKWTCHHCKEKHTLNSM